MQFYQRTKTILSAALRYSLAACTLLLTLASQSTLAGLLINTDLVGDIDGFGDESLLADLPDGFLLNCCFDNRDDSDPLFTDVWISKLPEAPVPISYHHSYAGSSRALSATLSIQTAGMGNNRGPWDVLFNGVSIGAIGGAIDPTEVSTNIFEVPINLLTGYDQITLSYADTIADGYAINYSQIAVTVMTQVAEPQILGMLLAGLLLARQFRGS